MKPRMNGRTPILACALVLVLACAPVLAAGAAFAADSPDQPRLPILSGGAVAPARTVMDGKTAFSEYQRGNYATALADAERALASNSQDAATMALIGQIYMDGFAVKIDHAEAARWFTLAAKRGDPQAAFALGRAYLIGDGVAKDVTRANAFLQQAAAKENAGALYNLGVLALQGDDKNFGAAADYFRRAANAGDAESYYALAILTRAGSGVPRDPTKATDLLRQAADARNVDGQVEYAIALFNGEGCPKNEQLAAKYFLMAAAANNAVAQNRIARMLAAGRGIPKNMIEAMKWHILARAAGVKDDWLDQQLATLSPQERATVQEDLKQFAE